MASQKGLGRGLGALLGDYGPKPSQDGALRTVPLYKVEPNPDQPRREFDEVALQDLADSIRLHGIIQPLTVREMENGYYQIIAGERRWRAARLAELSEVPVVVMEADDRKVMELALIENLQREDLNPVEEARGYQTLMEEYGLTQETAAKQVGKSRPAVANALRLLSLEPSVLQMVQEGKLSPGHAKAILSLKEPEKQREAAQKISALGLSVRQIPTQLTDTLWGLEVWADAGNSAVTPGGAADRAGIQAGDYILAVDGQEVHSSGDILKARWKHHVGDQMTLMIWRDGQIMDMTLELTDALTG